MGFEVGDHNSLVANTDITTTVLEDIAIAEYMRGLECRADLQVVGRSAVR